MMARDPNPKASREQGVRRVLPVVDAAASQGEACSTCRSNDWIWDEEIELVRAMVEVKKKVREARKVGDLAAVGALRNEFTSLRERMEKVRRQRLDSLGHVDYD
jgi:hypothetical protein